MNTNKQGYFEKEESKKAKRKKVRSSEGKKVGMS
jgi:hypothetical protein